MTEPNEAPAGAMIEKLVGLGVAVNASGIVQNYVERAAVDLSAWRRVHANRTAMGLSLTAQESAEKVAAMELNLACWKFILKAVTDRANADAMALSTSEVAVAGVDGS